MSETLRELDRIELVCSQPGMDEMRGNIYNLLSLEALVSVGPADLLSVRPILYNANPRERSDMREDAQQNAIQWMAQNPDRWRVMSCGYYGITPLAGMLQIDMPSLEDMRGSFPEQVTEYPRIENFFDGWYRMSHYIDNILRHMVLDRTENNPTLWNVAYNYMGRFEMH